MIALTLLVALGAAAAFYIVLRRVAFLEQELRRVESLIAAWGEAVREGPGFVGKASAPEAEPVI